jgi:molybdopterin-guanine dinucleotide biosynthesis protein A
MLSVSIQAGGESRRMGQNKALIPFLGKPLIQRVIERVTAIAGEILVITNDPPAYEFLGLPLIADKIPGHGVLGGLYTALLEAKQPYVTSIACDMPFVNANLLKIEIARLMAGAEDVVIPESASGLEPLHAVFRRDTCLPFVEEALRQNERRLISWFHRANVLVVSRAEVAQIDPDEQAFININTPADLAHAEALAKTRAD